MSQLVDVKALQPGVGEFKFAIDDLTPEEMDIDVVKFDPKVTHKFDVSGTYFAQAGDAGKLTSKPFCFQGIEMTDEEVKTLGALSAFVKGIGRDLIRVAHPDALLDTPFYEHYVVNSRSFKNGKELELPTEIRLMERNQALAYIDEHSLKIDPTLFEDIGQLQQAIKDIEKDERSFLRNQMIIWKKRGAQASSAHDAIRERNAELLKKYAQNPANAQTNQPNQPKPGTNKLGI